MCIRDSLHSQQNLIMRNRLALNPNNRLHEQQKALVLQSGLDDVRVELAPTFVTDYQVSRLVTWYDVTEKSALEAGILSEKELEEFHAELEKADSEGRYFATVLQIIVTGCKPYQ